MSQWKMCTHGGVTSKGECPWCKDDHIQQLQAEVEQLRQERDRRDQALDEAHALIRKMRDDDEKSHTLCCELAARVGKERQAADDLRQRCDALEAALNGSYSFVKGFHWLTPHDEPTYTRRKDTLKAIEELLKPDAAISAQAHGNGGEAKEPT